MRLMMITWTDIFEGTGAFFEWIFLGIRALGHIPNVLIWILIIGGIGYWTYRLMRYRKISSRNSTLE